MDFTQRIEELEHKIETIQARLAELDEELTAMEQEAGFKRV